MGLFGNKYGEKSANKAARNLGLRPANMAEMYGAHSPVLAHVAELAEQGRIAEVEPIYQAAWASKERLSDGKALYAQVLSLLDGEPEDPSAIPAFLEPTRLAFTSAPSAFTAAAHTQALVSAAFEARGYDYAHNTNAAQQAAFHELGEQAVQVLFSVPGQEADDFAWWNARAALIQVAELPDATRDEIFEKVWSLDRGNLAIIGARMNHLLPRWFGTDPLHGDRFAREAAAATAAEFGAGAYAFAYSSLTDEDDLEASDTGFDADLARQGFEDLLARTTSVSVLSRYARTMSWANEEATVLELFQRPLTAVAPGAWDAEDDDEGVQKAALAWLWASNNV